MAAERQIVPNQEVKLNCVCNSAELIIKHTKCSGPQMYYCTPCESTSNAGNRYCNKCGPLLHQIYGHSFDVNSSDAVSINQILKTKSNAHQACWGKNLLLTMIGHAKFHQIEPYLEKAPSVMSVGISGYVLYGEVATAMAEATTVAAKGAECAANGAVAVTKGAGFATKNVLNAGGVTMVIATLCEMAINGYRWKTGQISGKEWLRLTGKTIIRNAASFGGMAAGSKWGAGIGTGFAPGVGTAVGIVAGALVGFLCGVGASTIYEKLFPNGEEKAKKDAVKEAIKYFHCQEKDIRNKKIFNKKELRRRFKQFALDAHPDRRDGDHTEWNILSQHYGILLGLCEESNSNKKMVQKVLAIEH